MTNAKVLEAWLDCRPAHSNNLSTDGTHLYSYSLEIGRYRWSDETPVLLNYRKENSVSRTTSKHITQAIAACVQRNFNPLIINPTMRENYDGRNS